jgi:hypothetical protein
LKVWLQAEQFCCRRTDCSTSKVSSPITVMSTLVSLHNNPVSNFNFQLNFTREFDQYLLLFDVWFQVLVNWAPWLPFTDKWNAGDVTIDDSTAEHDFVLCVNTASRMSKFV